jgi:Mn2+/Fe2+ NRAMP family transporter
MWDTGGRQMTCCVRGLATAIRRGKGIAVGTCVAMYATRYELGEFMGRLAWFCMYAVPCIVVAILAGSKGRSFLGFLLLSLVFTPVVGLIVALIVLPRSPNAEEVLRQIGQGRKCPFCAEIVEQEAAVCRHCGRALPHP